jgi:hypothetical protein
MNCCDDNGKCTNGPDCAARAERSCDALGLCQGKSPRCDGCTTGLQLTSEGIRFAPGVIEHEPGGLLGTPAQRRELARWLVPSLLFSAVIGLVGLVVGLIAGRLS